jgi:hypothetical protein
MSASRYSNPRIVKRAKGQRYDASIGIELFGEGAGVRGLPAGFVPVQVGQGEGFQGDSNERVPLYFFEVTAPNGDVYPCYSFTAGVGADGYLICQDFTYKAARAA